MKEHKTINTVLVFILVLLLALLFAVPFFLVILNSLKESSAFVANPFSFTFYHHMCDCDCYQCYFKRDECVCTFPQKK